MKTVILDTLTNYEGETLYPENVKTLPDNVAERWVSGGIAHYSNEEKFTISKIDLESIKFSNSTSIIIPVCNCLDYLKKCLDSIAKYTNNFELIIIDNDSDIYTKKYIANLDRFDLKVVTNKKNKGFGYGCNQGIKVAIYDYICFLNSDTMVTPNWLYKLQKCFEVKKDCGFSSPTTCFSAGRQCDWNLAKNRFSMSEAEMLYYSNRLKEEYIQTEIYGFCMLTRKEILDKIGVFDYKRYGLGNTEELDLLWRAEQLGYKSYWAKETYVHHFGHMTFDELKISANGLVRKNSKIFEERKKDSNLFVKNDVKINDLKKYKVKRDKKVSVIIPVLDRLEQTIKTLEALFRNNKNINVIVIDNGSDDIDYLNKFNVKIIKNGENKGIIKALNQGIELTKSEYIVFMHNDIVINTGDWIDNAVKFMKDNPDVGMVGAAGWKKLEANGTYFDLFTMIDFYKKPPRKEFDEMATLDGCCIITRNIGLKFDENYGLMHLYDHDLSMQYRILGYRIFAMQGSATHFADDRKNSTIWTSRKYINIRGKTEVEYYKERETLFVSKWKEYLPIYIN